MTSTFSPSETKTVISSSEIPSFLAWRHQQLEDRLGRAASSYVNRKPAFCGIAHDCENIADTAEGKKGESPPLGVHEGAQNGILIEVQVRFSLTWSEPRGPEAHKRKPPLRCLISCQSKTNLTYTR